ncbi:cupin domain-containing protein [Aestuariibaculum marinum]|uniref:Cupin domain-containing protein n=1 Tax=Aestuariibaculum marinum TaxID=2683592 RepID=A0A8J6Q6D2_9FLAO|nr:cupin domain-containing protein [Aestuariibaculum marinum]MBD0825159.1 cupin domain-containing protein [Aestuariibaculum marinum]
MANFGASKVFLLGDDIEWEDLGGGIKRKIMGYDDNIMLVNVSFEAGGVGAMHKHPHVQVTYVASGEFEFTVGDAVKLVKEGDGLYIPPNTMHGTVCKKAGVLIDVFNPIREDFMQ